MPLPVNAVVSVNFPSIWQSQRYLLTTTWRVSATTSTDSIPDDVNSIATYFSSSLSGTTRFALQALMAPAVSMLPPRAQQITPVRSLYAIGIGTIGGAGIDAANTGNVAAVISLRTNFAGRSQIANKHIGPLPYSAYINGSPSATTVTQLGALATQLISGHIVPVGGGNDLTLLPVVFHKSSVSFSDITNFIVSDRMGTMRRRTLRVGE